MRDEKLEIDFGEGANPLQNVVQQLIFESNLQKKLEATDVVINALDKKIKDDTNAKEFQEFLHSLFDNNEFMRKLTLITQMKDIPELSVEYASFDYLSSPDYHYDIEFEKNIIIIKKKLQNFLGKLLKEMSKGVEIEL